MLVAAATYALGALTAGSPNQTAVRIVAAALMTVGSGLLLADAIRHRERSGKLTRLSGAGMLAAATLMTLAAMLAPGAPAARVTGPLSGLLLLVGAFVLAVDYFRTRNSVEK